MPGDYKACRFSASLSVGRIPPVAGSWRAGEKRLVSKVRDITQPACVIRHDFMRRRFTVASRLVANQSAGYWARMLKKIVSSQHSFPSERAEHENSPGSPCENRRKVKNGPHAEAGCAPRTAADRHRSRFRFIDSGACDRDPGRFGDQFDRSAPDRPHEGFQPCHPGVGRRRRSCDHELQLSLNSNLPAGNPGADSASCQAAAEFFIIITARVR